MMIIMVKKLIRESSVGYKIFSQQFEKKYNNKYILMNKTNMIILGLMGIIAVFYLFTDRRIMEGLENKEKDDDIEHGEPTIGIGGQVDNPDEIIRIPKKKKEKKKVDEKCPNPCPAQCPKLPPPPPDPNAGLITTCTNLVKSHTNKCTAAAAGLMTKAFGPKDVKPGKHEHAIDNKMLDFLRSLESKLKKMVLNKKVTDEAIKLAPQYAPKLELPERRGFSPQEYTLWRQVLQKRKGPKQEPIQFKSEPKKVPASRPRDIKVFVTDNRVTGQKNQVQGGKKDGSHTHPSPSGQVGGSGAAAAGGGGGGSGGVDKRGNLDAVNNEESVQNQRQQNRSGGQPLRSGGGLDASWRDWDPFQDGKMN